MLVSVIRIFVCLWTLPSFLDLVERVEDGRRRRNSQQCQFLSEFNYNMFHCIQIEIHPLCYLKKDTSE